jgi:glycosyltransferase involved in cell wall biosynthesis
LIFNNMDLHYLRVERQAKVERSAALALQAEKLKTLELATMATADVICVPSAVEAQLLAHEKLRAPVFVMPFMVDLHPPVAGRAARGDVVFLGGFGHTPNVDAAVWMAKTLWPRLRSRLRGAKLILAGANPTPEVLDLAAADIMVPGRIDDLGPLFEQARVFVAPLRYGAGVKGKIYSAMAHGVPVVSTSIGTEGMGVEPDLEVLLGDDPETFCQQVLALYDDADTWTRLSRAGTAFVRRTSTVEAGVAVMGQVIQAARQVR